MYAVPRQLAPTRWENTRVRASPRIRDKTVRPAITAAPRAMPAAARWLRSESADKPGFMAFRVSVRASRGGLWRHCFAAVRRAGGVRRARGLAGWRGQAGSPFKLNE